MSYKCFLRFTVAPRNVGMQSIPDNSCSIQKNYENEHIIIIIIIIIIIHEFHRDTSFEQNFRAAVIAVVIIIYNVLI